MKITDKESRFKVKERKIKAVEKTYAVPLEYSCALAGIAPQKSNRT
jgi:hypothetical protein